MTQFMTLAPRTRARTFLFCIILLLLVGGVGYSLFASGSAAFSPWSGPPQPAGTAPNEGVAEFNRNYRLTHENTSPALWAVSLLYMAATGLVGYCFWRLIFEGGSVVSFWRFGHFGGERKFPRVLLLFAGFSIGYPIVAAVNRIVSLFVLHGDAPYRLFVFWLCVGAACCLRALVAKRGASPWSKRAEFGAAAVLVAALLVLLVLQLQMGVFYVSGDATSRVFQNLVYWIPVDKRFPLVSSHYDEPLFLYPLISLEKWFGKSYGQLLPFLIFHAVGRVSAICLAYCLVKPFCRGVVSALAVALLMVMGSHLLHPFLRAGIFDAKNPPLWALHESRVLSATFPLLLLILSFRSFSSDWRLWRWGDKLGAAAYLVLFGAGLSTMSLHIAIIAVAAFAASLLSRLQEFRSPGESVPTGGAVAVAILTTAAVGSVYLIPLVNLWGALVLLGAAVLSGLIMLVPIRVRSREGPRPSLMASALAAIKALPQVQFAVSGMVIGFLLLGQSVGSTIAARLFGLKVVFYSSYAPGDIDLRYIPFVSVKHAGLIWLDHAPLFLTFFGLALGLGCLGAATLWAFPGKVGKEEAGSAPRRMLTWGLPVMMAMLPLAFFALTFIGLDPYVPHAVWVRTRLLEAPFYTTLLLGLLACFVVAQQLWVRRLLTLLVFIWAFGPILVALVVDSLPAQLRLNFEALMSILF